MEQRPSSVIRSEFIVEKQGRTFALLAGLLDAAHRDGLRNVETQLLQIGSEENNQTWLFRAVVVTDRGTFTGHGDASPANVGRAMLNVLPRMAESRAIARALRFAVNAGAVVAFEELGEEDVEALPAPPQQTGTAAPRPAATATPRQTNGLTQAEAPRTTVQSAPPPPPQPPQPSATAQATPAQVRAIYSIARDQHNMSEGEVDERSQALFGCAPVDLTRKQASELITSLKGNNRAS